MIAADMNCGTVMLNFERGTYFGMNGVGSRIWELLHRPILVATIVEVICSEYDVDEQTCTSDIQRFLDEMIKNDLVLVA